MDYYCSVFVTACLSLTVHTLLSDGSTRWLLTHACPTINLKLLPLSTMHNKTYVMLVSSPHLGPKGTFFALPQMP